LNPVTGVEPFGARSVENYGLSGKTSSIRSNEVARMQDKQPSMEDIVDAIADATRNAVTALFREHSGEHFYYIALFTSGNALPPNLVAWSTEALERAVKGAPDEETARVELKWSYAESPFYCYGDEYFDEVLCLFDLLPEMNPVDDHDWEAQYEFRLSAMVKAMQRLEQEGLFGRGPERERIVMNVEVVPPDHANTKRAQLLNPPAALSEWMQEAAEPE
jgi:hypothetical protein